MCDEILENSAQSIAAHKALHQAAENMTLAEGLEFERKARFDITDSNERITAFQKTRK
jgi:enoyl-CoA hydratase/carnithine racemase